MSRPGRVVQARLFVYVDALEDPSELSFPCLHAKGLLL